MSLGSITSRLQADGNRLSIEALLLIEDLKTALKNLKAENKKLRDANYMLKVRMQQLRDSDCGYSE